ncbi:MAG TPA: hypothetical protein VE870_06585 [Bacteroidales bacterium]|nr:hypothetical protein [Bacteroidales bacterium]
MNDLEKLARQNRSMFDDHEPKAGHFTRFEKRLNKKTPGGVWSGLLRIAAAFLAGIIIASAGYYYLSRQSDKSVMAGLPNEVRETLYYYNTVRSEMISEIKSYPLVDKEARNKLLDDLNKQDPGYQKLLDDLKKYPNNESVIHALIEYHKSRVELLQYILSQLESKQQNHTIIM